MTKEEALNKIIEYCKNGSKTPVSDFCRIPCSICPFNNDYYVNCENDVVDSLFERLLKAEEFQKAETNFDHFIKNYFVTTYENKVTFKLKEGWKETFENFDIDDFKEWLLSPYEEPKPTYKLSKFEYDLIDFCKQYNDTFVIEDWAVLMDMHDKGYFKDIPTDVPIGEILANCEVVEE